MLMRAFVAIDLSENVKDYLAELQEPLTKLRYLTPVDPKIMHITLKFLGEINEKDLGKIKTNMMKLKGKYKLTLDKVGTFPGRVIWVSAKDNEETSEIAKQLENYDFHNHITLARIKGKANLTDFLKIKVEPLEFQVNKIVLKESKLTPDGPEYSNIFEVDL